MNLTTKEKATRLNELSGKVVHIERQLQSLNKVAEILATGGDTNANLRVAIKGAKSESVEPAEGTGKELFSEILRRYNNNMAGHLWGGFGAVLHTEEAVPRCKTLEGVFMADIDRSLALRILGLVADELVCERSELVSQFETIINEPTTDK